MTTAACKRYISSVQNLIRRNVAEDHPLKFGCWWALSKFLWFRTQNLPSSDIYLYIGISSYHRQLNLFVLDTLFHWVIPNIWQYSSPLSQTSSQVRMLRSTLLSSVLFKFSLSREYRILQTFFPHYMPGKPQLCLPDVNYKSPFCYHCL